MQTRRDFLRLAAMLSGAGLVPSSIQRAYAIEPQPGSTWLDAEHIVFLMQENRSFDHALGTLRGVRGFNDPRALRLANGNSVFVQTDAAGNSYAPWRLDIRDTRITWMGDIPHSRHSQVDAWNEGHHNGWIEAKRSSRHEYAAIPITMGHYTREDIPFYYALADAFTVCDQNYCAVMTSTTPNRSYFWTGTVRDKQSADSLVYMRNNEIERGGMTWKTFPERLQEAGISWKFYQNELTNSPLTGDEDAWLGNFGCNLLESFAAYNVEAYPGYLWGLKASIVQFTKEAEKIEKALSDEHDEAAAAKLRSQLAEIKSQIEDLKAKLPNGGESRYAKLSDHERALHHAAFVTNANDPDYHSLQSLSFEDQGKSLSMKVPKGDIFHQFRKDVNEGKLPTISWLASPEKFSDHPTSPWYGAWYLSEVMDILTKNPEVWKKTIFILTYDENDGYFDHAPSYVAADPKRPETGGASSGIDTALEYTYKEDELKQGVSEKDARSGPVGMGFRVPMIIASPWSRQAKYGKTVREENISAWRRAISGDLTSAFRPYDPGESRLEFLGRDKFVVSIEKARFKEVPSNFQKLTPEQIEEINGSLKHSKLSAHQEEGVKPSCALPYELYVDGGLSPDGKHFNLTLVAGNRAHGANSVGAPFNVYLRNLGDASTAGNKMTAATYALKAGDTLTKQIPVSTFADAAYAIDIHGPNGFYRAFTGRAASQPLIEVRADYERVGTKLTGNVQLQLRNPGAKNASVVITDNAYKASPIEKAVESGQEASIVLNLKHSNSWYDFTVRSEGSEAEFRYAGRVETGNPSTSDPFMGGVV
jgi:phospholipase C